MTDDELNAEHSGKAVNRCIVGLSVGKNDVNDVVGRWGDVSMGLLWAFIISFTVNDVNNCVFVCSNAVYI